jgi:hypothetical protein
MRKRFESFLVVVSLFVMAASVTVMSESTAKAQPKAGYTCLNIVGPKTCSWTGDTACQYAQGGNPNNCKGTCAYCDIDTAIGNAVCVTTYAGESCTPTTGQVNCGAGVEKTGGCAKPQGTCFCLYGIGTKTCPAANYTYTRCGAPKN